MTDIFTNNECSYRVRGLSDAAVDVIYFETDRTDESIEISWHPDEPFSPVRKTWDQGCGPQITVFRKPARGVLSGDTIAAVKRIGGRGCFVEASAPHKRWDFTKSTSKRGRPCL